MQLTDKQKSEGWHIVKFGNVAQEIKAYTQNPLGEGFERYVGLEHIDQESLKLVRYGLIDEDNPTFTKKFSAGDILFGRRRAYLKKAAVADFDGICSGDITVIAPKGDDLVTELLPFIVQSEPFFDWAVKHSAGGLSPRTKFKSLAEFEFPLPPRPRQEKMLGVFEKIEDSNIKNQKVTSALLILKKSLINNYLTGKQRLPGFNGSWKSFKLQKLVNFHKGKFLPKSRIENNAPFKCIHYGELFTQYKEEIKNVKSRTAQGLKKSFLSKLNDILMPTSDVTPNGLATASCVQEDNIILGADILIMRPKENSNISGIFLSHLIRFNKVEIMKRVTGTTVFHIYASDLKHLPIFIPESTEEQMEIVNRLNAVEENINKLECNNDNLRKLRKHYTSLCLNRRTT